MHEQSTTGTQTSFLRWRGPWAFTGWVLVGLGGAGIAGWASGAVALVQPFRMLPPIRPSAAFALLALGVGALAVDQGRRGIALAAVSVASVLGLVALAQLVGQFDVGLDRLILGSGPELRIPASSPEYPPLSTAVGLVLGGGALAIMLLRLDEPGGAFVVGVVGSTLVALNLVLLMSQLLGVSPGVQFGPVVGSSPHVVLGLLALGASLASAAWSRDWMPTTYPGWTPVAAGLATLTAVLFLWRALIQGQHDDHRAFLAAASRGLAVNVKEEMGRADWALWRVTWVSTPAEVGSSRWTRYVEGVVSSTPGMMSIAWLRRDGTKVVFAPPPAGGDSVLLRAQLGMQVAAGPPPTVSSAESVWHFSLADSTHTLGIVAPRCDLDSCDGFVIGLLRVNDMLRSIVGDSVDGYHRSIAWRGTTLVGHSVASSVPREEVYRSSVRVADMKWDLVVWPTDSTRERMLTGLPELVLAFGLLLSGLLPVSLQLGRTLKANARTAEQVRLRLALGRSMDRAWSWEVPGQDRPEPALLSNSSGQEIRRGSWTELVHPEDRRRVEAVLSAHLEDKTPAFEAQYRIRGASGEWHWRVDRGHVSERADGPGATPIQMLGVSGDVSERRRVEEERESIERRFLALFDSAYQLQSLLDLDGRVLEANATALNLLEGGVRIEDVRGKKIWEVPWWPDPATAELIQQAGGLARRGHIVTREIEMVNAAGDRVVVDLTIRPIRNAEGQVVQLLAEGRDITARRRAEDQLKQVETLTTMGRLAARVAHEINNPLAGIQNSFFLLRDAIPPTHPHYAYVGAIEREIGRIAGVTRQLYETYRPDANRGGNAGVRTLIADAVAFLEQVNRPSGVRIQVDLDAAPAFVAVPESVLRQSVYNLVQNAVEASPPGGTITVQAETVDSTFVLRVRDQGPGIPLEARTRIFDPFVSTKGRDLATGGMGIGLSLVHGSVHALGGTIEILDPPGGGTEFVVRLPITPPQTSGNV